MIAAYELKVNVQEFLKKTEPINQGENINNSKIISTTKSFLENNKSMLKKVFDKYSYQD